MLNNKTLLFIALFTFIPSILAHGDRVQSGPNYDTDLRQMDERKWENYYSHHSKHHHHAKSMENNKTTITHQEHQDDDSGENEPAMGNHD